MTSSASEVCSAHGAVPKVEEDGSFMLGSWQAEGADDKFNDFLAQLGVGFLQRKIAVSTNPVLKIDRNPDGSYVFTTKSLVKTSQMVCKFGVPFMQRTLDDKDINTIVTLKSKTLTIREDAKESRPATMVQRIFDDSIMTTIYKCGSVESRRRFTRVSA